MSNTTSKTTRKYAHTPRFSVDHRNLLTAVLSINFRYCLDQKMLRLLNAKVAHTRPNRPGGWKGLDQKVDCLLQGHLNQELEE